jgi:hypothetical protein
LIKGERGRGGREGGSERLQKEVTSPTQKVFAFGCCKRKDI